MTYADRNSLLLGAVLGVVLAAGLYGTQVRQRDCLLTLAAQDEALDNELAQVNAVVSTYDSTRARLDALEQRWLAGGQVIPATDSPAATLAYLFDLQERVGAYLPFDFRYSGRMDAAGYSENRYELAGRGAFQDLYAFLWQIEQGRRFCSVDRVDIAYNEPDTALYSATWAWVDYRVSMRSFFEPSGRIPESVPVRAAPAPPPLSGNPFVPLITRSLPANDGGLLDVDQVRLAAVAYGVACLVDRKGRASLLHEGDRVYLGELSKVDVAHNQVTFRLNKGGILEHRTMEIDTNGTAP